MELGDLHMINFKRPVNINLILAFFLVIIAMIIAPFIASQTYIMHILIIIFIFATLSQSWNLLAGYAGQISVGHATFFGMGAYTLGLLTLYLTYFRNNPWPALILGGFVASLVGLALGIICFRLRGPFFALATLAATEVIRLIIMNTEFTKGAIGIIIPTPPSISTPFFIIDFREKLPYYYISLIMMLISFYIVYLISNSRYGLLLQSIRDDEDAAISLGVNSFKLKLLTIFISGFIGGVAGALYAVYISYIDPALDPGGVLTFFTSIDPILISVIGGMGTIIGPFLGAVLRFGVGEYLRMTFGWRAGMDLIVFGVLFMIIFLIAPEGIWGFIKLRVIKIIRRYYK